jgi:serine/threonine protein kinase
MTWVWHTPEFHFDIEQKEEIGRGMGGFSVVYRLRDGRILKIVKQNGDSENAKIYRDNKHLIPEGEILIETYSDVQNDDQDFIQQIKNEVSYQQYAYETIKDIEGNSVTAQIFGAGVCEIEKKQYGYILMEEIIGIPFIQIDGLSEERAIDIRNQLHYIMYQMHRNGFVHNDMLMGNVILVGPRPIVKTIDWGIACSIWLAPFWLIQPTEELVPYIRQQIEKEKIYNETPLYKQPNTITGPYLLDEATYRTIDDLNHYIERVHLEKEKSFGCVCMGRKSKRKRDIRARRSKK